MSDDVKWLRKLWPGDKIQRKDGSEFAEISSIGKAGVALTRSARQCGSAIVWEGLDRDWQPCAEPEPKIAFQDLTGWNAIIQGGIVIGMVDPEQWSSVCEDGNVIGLVRPMEPTEENQPVQTRDQIPVSELVSVFGSAKLKDITSGEKNTPIGSDAPDRFEPTEAWLNLYREAKRLIDSTSDEREFWFIRKALESVTAERHKDAADHV